MQEAVSQRKNGSVATVGVIAGAVVGAAIAQGPGLVAGAVVTAVWLLFARMMLTLIGLGARIVLRILDQLTGSAVLAAIAWAFLSQSFGGTTGAGVAAAFLVVPLWLAFMGFMIKLLEVPLELMKQAAIGLAVSLGVATIVFFFLVAALQASS